MIRCLAIDDDALFLKLLKVYFEEMESAELISTFSNSIEGVMACVKEHPDILLLDLEMPYLDGMEALETLDNPPKVIVISGHLDGREAVNIPIDKFLSKSEVKSAKILEQVINEVV